MKYNQTLLLVFAIVQLGAAQDKYEQESRIDKEEFPSRSFSLIEDYLKNARRVRFYKETDSTKLSYEAKFKKDRLRYSVEFDKNGALEDVEFIIKERDIPNDTWNAIVSHLKKNHAKYRIKKIQQQHPVKNGQSEEKTLHNAFQNLILPEVNYELVFSAKEKRDYQEYEALFDSEGQPIRVRKSFPPSYDHVLY
ncbi:hypothetical protein K1F50_05575 [Muricauda oceani]|uniref:Uncharacterized protein n=2 Tax=Flagellimonas oceani TaxID=2698672 RepID=A0A6G7J9G5_9FLAO|nr:hypothetical protein [Allomuricauda oceani]QII47184.1 hypothetical protein GVT53_15505 [Allomuricauda oceani]